MKKFVDYIFENHGSQTAFNEVENAARVAKGFEPRGLKDKTSRECRNETYIDDSGQKWIRKDAAMSFGVGDER
jgi:hypothetical protein